MNISEKLSQKELQNILLNIYEKGQELEEKEIVNIIEDIKQQILTVINSKE